MSRNSITARRTCLGLAAVLLLAACSERGSLDPGADSEAGALSVGGTNHTTSPTPTTVTLCKVGSDATFSVSVNHGAPFELTLADGACQVILTHFQPSPRDSAVIEELAAGGIVLDSIAVVVNVTGTRTVLTGTSSVASFAGDDTGRTVTFYNTMLPPPGGGEGCTPGYWKQKQHFDSWPAPYTPGTQFSSVFENAFPGLTLLDVLKLGGGGLNALGRHTVAALLNGASGGVSYDLTGQQVIDAFNAVYPGGGYEGQKNVFEGFNEQGCPLN